MKTEEGESLSDCCAFYEPVLDKGSLGVQLKVIYGVYFGTSECCGEQAVILQ